MKIQRDRTSTKEITILIGMITDDTVCGKLADKWSSNMFRNKYANLIGNWCVDYYQRYEHAPRKRVQHKFERWIEKTKDRSTVELVEQFLVRLSDEYATDDAHSTEYVLDVAGEYFALVQLERLRDDLEDQLDQQDASKAVALINEYNQFNLGVGEWFDPIDDKHAIIESLRNASKPIIAYDGALGDFFGNSLERDGLICFEGPEKRGKTFWLMDIVMRAVEQRRRVAYFQVGDMSRNQIMRRMLVRIAEHPLRAGTVYTPRQIMVKHPPKNSTAEPRCRVRKRAKVFKTALHSSNALKACKQFQRERLHSYRNYLRLSVHPNNSLSASELRRLLKQWARDGWVADVVVIDYADILRMSGDGEQRDKINKCWQELRRISQELHCLVVTASQTNAASYNARIVRKSHYSEDKRKRAHSTGNIGLNQTDDEKRKGVMRLNWIQRREEFYTETRCVYVAGCVDLANIAMKSSY